MRTDTVSLSTIDELFAATLQGDYDSDAPWEAVIELQRLGTREVLSTAVEWCDSTVLLKRARGADVLSQFGKTADHPSINYPDECFAALSGLVSTESEARPLCSAIYGFGHQGNAKAVHLVIGFCNHPNSEVRFATTFALGCFADLPDAAKALLQLSSDSDDDVRDWATFGLGVLGREDSPEIRDALAVRLNDTCNDAREEAMVGLAKRKDPRVISSLILALESLPVPDRAIEAASEMLGHQDGWDKELSGRDYAAALRKEFGT
jgi:HEAT repeat protein